MPLFTLQCRDRPGALALRAATRPAHLEWLAGLGAAVKLGGPWMDADGQPTGSLLIVEAQSAQAAAALAAQDPYALAGLFASTEITPWRLVVGGFAA